MGGTKHRGTKRNGSKRRGTKRRRSKRRGTKRGGGVTCSRIAPVKIFRNRGEKLSNALFHGRTDGDAIKEIRDLLDCDITKRRTPENSGDGVQVGDGARSVLNGTVLHTLVDNILWLTFENFKKLTDVIIENPKIGKIVNMKNSNNHTVFQMMMNDADDGNFATERHRLYLAEKLGQVQGIIIPRKPSCLQRRGRDPCTEETEEYKNSLWLINVATGPSPKHDEPRPRVRGTQTKSATSVKATVKSKTTKSSSKGSKSRSPSVPSFKGKF